MNLENDANGFAEGRKTPPGHHYSVISAHQNHLQEWHMDLFQIVYVWIVGMWPRDFSFITGTRNSGTWDFFASKCCWGNEIKGYSGRSQVLHCRYSGVERYNNVWSNISSTLTHFCNSWFSFKNSPEKVSWCLWEQLQWWSAVITMRILLISCR